MKTSLKAILILLTVPGMFSVEKNKRILLEDNYYTIISRLEALETDMAAVKAGNSSKLGALEKDVNAIKAGYGSKLDALEKDVATLKAQSAKTSHSPVAFMAYLTKTVTGTNHHIYFDNVRLNPGNAYNPHHGMFAAPVNGIYQFTVTACSASGHYIALELTVNSSNLGKVRAGDIDYTECSSKTFLAQLQSGDDVFVQHVAVGNNLVAYSSDGFPSFTGVLLQEI